MSEAEPPETVPAPFSLVPHLGETAVLLDIDGTLLDIMPTPREVWVPPGLASTLNSLYRRTGGALALVSGRSLNDIDLIFAPDQFPVVAGAANELDAALLVNPHDIDGMARTIATALAMPLTERRMRWEVLIAKLRRRTIRQWFADFVEELQETQTEKGVIPPLMPDAPACWSRHPAQAGARMH